MQHFSTLPKRTLLVFLISFLTIKPIYLVELKSLEIIINIKTNAE